MKAKNTEKIFVLNSVCLSFHFPPYFEEKLENNVATKSASKDYGKFPSKSNMVCGEKVFYCRFASLSSCQICGLLVSSNQDSNRTNSIKNESSFYFSSLLYYFS